MKKYVTYRVELNVVVDMGEEHMEQKYGGVSSAGDEHDEHALRLHIWVDEHAAQVIARKVENGLCPGHITFIEQLDDDEDDEDDDEG